MANSASENKEMLRAIDEALLLARIFDMADIKSLDIGMLARIHRAKRNLTIEAAAKEIGISRHLLSEIEDGKIPQRSKLSLMVNFYGDGFRAGLQFIELGREVTV